MDAYARPGEEPNTWILINGAFTLTGAMTSQVVLDANDPGQNLTTVVSDLPFPHDWIERATPEEIAAIGAKKILPADSPPQGHVTESPTLVDFAGSPKWKVESHPIGLDDAKAEARARLSGARWQASQTFTYQGVKTSTTGGLAALQMRSLLGIPDGEPRIFKLAPGEFRSWDKGQEDLFAAAIAGWLQSRIDIEAAIDAEIAASEDVVVILGLPDDADWSE